MSLNRRNRVRVSIISSAIVLLVTPCGLTAQSPADDLPEPTPTAATPSGGEYVRAVRLLTIPRGTSGGAEAAVASDQGVYLAGKWWNREEKSNLWLWRIDDSGKKVWEKRLAHQDGNETLAIVGLLPGARQFTEGDPVPGVRVVYGHGLETKLAFFRADGEQVLQKKIEGLADAHGLATDDNDTLYLFGTSDVAQDQPIHTWIARVTRLGSVLWKHTFRAEEVAATGASGRSDEAVAVPAGFLQVTLLHDGTMLGDGSLVFVGQTGVYNKFGQGKSKLWLLRIDRDGKRLAEAFVDGGRVFPSGRDLIANCNGEVIVPYTTEQLPPISEAPLNVPPGFGIRLARFNAELEKLWDKPLGNSTMPGAATITGPAPFVSLTAEPDKLLIRGTADEGDELWIARVATPDSFVTPLATLRSGDDIISVFNYRRQRPRDADRFQEVLLVYVRPPSR